MNAKTFKDFCPDIAANPELNKWVTDKKERQAFFIKMAGVKAACESGKFSDFATPKFDAKDMAILLDSPQDVKALYEKLEPLSSGFMEMLSNPPENAESAEFMQKVKKSNAAFTLIGNDADVYRPGDEQTSFNMGGNSSTLALNDLKDEMEASLKSVNSVQEMACFHFGHDIDPLFDKRPAKEQALFTDFVMKHPREVLVLAALAQNGNMAGHSLQVTETADLQQLCGQADVKKEAAKICFADREATIQALFQKDHSQLPQIKLSEKIRPLKQKVTQKNSAIRSA